MKLIVIVILAPLAMLCAGLAIQLAHDLVCIGLEIAVMIREWLERDPQ